MGGQQKNFISDIVFFQHQDGMRKKVWWHFLQCSNILYDEQGVWSTEAERTWKRWSEVDPSYHFFIMSRVCGPRLGRRRSRHGSDGMRLTHPTVTSCMYDEQGVWSGAPTEAERTWQCLSGVDPSYNNILYIVRTTALTEKEQTWKGW